jgi:hypothetical protein
MFTSLGSIFAARALLLLKRSLDFGGSTKVYSAGTQVAKEESDESNKVNFKHPQGIATPKRCLYA